LKDITLILLAAGSSSRFELDVKKQWLRIGHLPLWQFVTNSIEKKLNFNKIIITSSSDDIEFMRNYADFAFVEGSTTRQLSLKNALKHVDTEFVLVSDIARSCISQSYLEKIISLNSSADCIVPYLNVTDTIVYDGNTIDRDKVKRIQTPQLSKTMALTKALDTKEEFTDESSAIVANGGSREFILGDEDALKITHISDLKNIPCLEAPSNDTLSGTGFDVHAFEEGKKMFLGGVLIDSSFGFKAHSDGDVGIHALIDALLGAAGLGDIGMLFPDIYNFGFVITNVDLTIMAEVPRVGKYKLPIRKVLSNILKIDMSRVNVKATTTEKLGFIGRGEGVSVMANANLKYYNWKEEEN